VSVKCPSLGRRRSETRSFENNLIGVGVVFVLLSIATIVWQYYHDADSTAAKGLLSGGLLVIAIGVISSRVGRR